MLDEMNTYAYWSNKLVNGQLLDPIKLHIDIKNYNGDSISFYVLIGEDGKQRYVKSIDVDFPFFNIDSDIYIQLLNKNVYYFLDGFDDVTIDRVLFVFKKEEGLLYSKV